MLSCPTASSAVAMDREAKPTTDVLTSRPNGRGSAGLVINKDTRKPLFGRKTNDQAENDRKRETGGRVRPSPSPGAAAVAPKQVGRSAPFDAKDVAPARGSATRPVTSPETRIPGPKSSGGQSRPRRPFTLTDAYKMAEDEEIRRQGEPVGGDVSPSPAPRPWLSRHESDKEGMRKMLDRSPVEAKGFRRHFSRGSADSTKSTDSTRNVESRGSARSGSSLSDLERRARRAGEGNNVSQESLGYYGEEAAGLHRTTSEPAKETGSHPIRNLFSRSRIGPKIAEAGNELARKTSNTSLEDDTLQTGRRLSPSKGVRTRPSIERFIGIALDEEAEGRLPLRFQDPDNPLPSVENGRTPQEPTPPSSRPVSANPLGLSPNKSYAWDVDADFTGGDLQVSNSPRIRISSKLNEIKQRELDPSLQLDDSSLDLGTPSRNSKEPEESPQPGKPTVRQRQNRKLDEIREREIESLSRRAIATSRLDEIREINSSFDSERQGSREYARETTPGVDPETGDRRSGRSFLEEEGEKIPNTPITIFRKPSDDKNGNGSGKGSRSSSGSRPVSHIRDESRELLRSLARVTSISPNPESDKNLAASSNRPELDRRNGSGKTSNDSRQSSNDRLKLNAPEIRQPDSLKPTVGFAGLRRTRSTDSTNDNRSSMALSENDPTERLEQEMKLFAPLESHSERGSIRAPSPDSGLEDGDGDDEETQQVEETPRAPRKDPLSMATPKVTGAYVETPATVKVEKLATDGDIFAEAGDGPRRSRSTSQSRAKPASAGSSTSSESDTRHRATAQASAETTSTARRRATSLPKKRRPLINTAKPPTVRDDLQAITRAHNIEDSTLDDFGELLAGRRSFSPDIEAIMSNRDAKREPAIKDEKDVEDRERLDRERELETYDRMNKSLQTGLAGIRTAKQGIERLQDKVAHADVPAPAPAVKEKDTHLPKKRVTRTAITPTSAVTYILLPVPRLSRREPTFRLTILGLIVLLASVYLASEWTMCSLYCRPVICTDAPCAWSVDDPTPGWALPVKLDQWVAGGAGRRLAEQAAEEVGDYVADILDVVKGRDIKDVDINALTFSQKRRHRRRLRKRGLVPPRVEPPEERAKWDAWRRVRLARERASASREMGYDVGEGDEGFSADERLS